MKVLLIIARFEFGGIPTQAFLWARYLKAHGYDPVILAGANRDNRYCDLLADHNIGFGVLHSEQKGKGLINTLRYLFSLIKALNAFRAFAILPFNKTLAYNISVIWRFTNVSKCYFMERNNFEDLPTSFTGRLLRKFSLYNSSALIFNSYSAAAKSPYPDRTFVIRNSFVNPIHQDDANYVNPLANLDSEAFVLLHVANIARQKNYPLLLKAWPILKSRHPHLYLVIAGREVQEKLPEVMSLMTQPGIIYLGSQPNVMPLIQRADLCLLSTFYEGCPNIILEYMSQKKLICASDVPALREVLAEPNHALLFNNDDELSLVSKIETALKLDASLKTAIVSTNLSKLHTDYSEKNYEQIIELLKK